MCGVECHACDVVVRSCLARRFRAAHFLAFHGQPFWKGACIQHMASHETVGRLICPGYENLGIPTLYVHDLTGSKDADRLLSKPPLIHPATPNILPKLRRWNPEVASAFSEKDNAVKRIPFKLVTKNRIWSPIKTNSFQAVSYCWHNNQWTVPARFSETPEDWPLPMSPAMLRALLCCTKDGEAVWIDQLCIDQNEDRKSVV